MTYLQHIKYLDLFSGIGGFRYSLEKTSPQFNLKPVCSGFSEIDKFAIKTYNVNYDLKEDEVNIGDISSFKDLIDKPEYIKIFENTDIIFAGFPCQSFSIFGNKKGLRDNRGSLFYKILDVLNFTKPKFLLFENVRGIKYHDSGKTLKKMIKILDKLGYHTVIWEINTENYGLPQTRRRIYFLVFKKNVRLENLNIPKEVATNDREYRTVWHLLERDVSEKYYLSEKIKKTILANGSGKFHYKSEINKLIARPLTATMHKMHRANQDNYYSDDFINGEFNNVQNRVNNSNSGKNLIRRITPQEAFTLQGYPKRFVDKAKKAGLSDTQLYRQAGNSVSINVVELILKMVFNNTNLLDVCFSN